MTEHETEINVSFDLHFTLKQRIQLILFNPIVKVKSDITIIEHKAFGKTELSMEAINTATIES